VFYGIVNSEAVANLQDVRGVNVLIFVLLAVAIIGIGVWPDPLLNVFHASVGHLLDLTLQSRLA